MNFRGKPRYTREYISPWKKQRKSDADKNTIEIIRSINRLVDVQEAASQQSDTQDKKKACREIFTIIVIIITAGVALWQVTEMRRVYEPILAQAVASQEVVSEMRTSSAQTERSVRAAETLATTSQGQMDLSSEISQTQLRAYVSAVPFLPNPISNDRANLHTINVGNTPAIGLRHRGEMDILPYPIPANFAFPASTGEFDLTNMTLFPNLPVETYAKTNRTYSAAEVSDATIGKTARYYVWGEIEYRDVFNHPRITRYCITYYGSGETKSWSYCDRHNSAD